MERVDEGRSENRNRLISYAWDQSSTLGTWDSDLFATGQIRLLRSPSQILLLVFLKTGVLASVKPLAFLSNITPAIFHHVPQTHVRISLTTKSSFHTNVSSEALLILPSVLDLILLMQLWHWVNLIPLQLEPI